MNYQNTSKGGMFRRPDGGFVYTSSDGSFRMIKNASPVRSTILGSVRRSESRQAWQRDLNILKKEKRDRTRKERDENRSRKAEIRSEIKSSEREFANREIRVEKKKIPFAFIAVILIMFILFIMVAYNFSEVAKSSSELSKLKNDLQTIEEESAKLSVELDRKNDIEVIEKFATEELKMEREDALQKRYISVSDGDRIVLENNSSEQSGGGFAGGLLSAAASVFDNLIDYFK